MLFLARDFAEEDIFRMQCCASMTERGCGILQLVLFH